MVPSYPATSRQRWWACADRDGRSALNVPVVAALHDGDERALGAALQALVDRHDALRTRLRPAGDDLVQEVAPAVPVAVVAEEAPGCADPVALQRRILAVLDEPFDVRGGPLLRARLLRITPGRSVLVVSCHHAVCDGWSAGILFRDLAELYRAELRGRPPALPALELQFPDYAAWEWALATEPPTPHWHRLLGAGHPRSSLGGGVPATGPGTFRSFPFPVIAPGTAADLARLAAAHRTTPARVVTAGVVASLLPLFGPRLTIGAFVGNREQPELLDVVGDLADRVPIVVDATDEPAFGDLLDRIDASVADALERYAPMAALAPLIRSDPARRSGPLLDVTVNYLPHRVQRDPADGAGAGPREELVEVDVALERRSFRVDRWQDGFALLDYQHRPRPDSSIGGYLLANVDVVPPAEARTLAATTTATLTRLVADPRRPVGAGAGRERAAVAAGGRGEPS